MNLDDIRTINRMVYHIITCPKSGCDDCVQIREIVHKTGSILNYYSNDLRNRYRD